MILSDSGEVYSWGTGNAGQLGNGKARSRYTPLAIAGLRGKYVTQVAAGEQHSAAISGLVLSPKTFVEPFHCADSGLLYTWGSADHCRLGYLPEDDNSFQVTPAVVPASYWGDKRVVQVACGATFTTAVIEDGSVFTFGLNSVGQLGVGDLESRSDDGPVQVVGLESVEIRKVACGYAHTAAISGMHLPSLMMSKFLNLGEKKPDICTFGAMGPRDNWALERIWYDLKNKKKFFFRIQNLPPFFLGCSSQ